jgi:hypothetical protein
VSAKEKKSNQDSVTSTGVSLSEARSRTHCKETELETVKTVSAHCVVTRSEQATAKRVNK